MLARLAFIALALAFASMGAAGRVSADETVLVFAAASLKNALDAVNAGITRNTRIVASYAASSALMKQIEQGAPADVFISADVEWMDYAAQKALVKNDTRVDLLGNRLVLIAPKDAGTEPVQIGS
jgi:molybdate transport system substrate-binding protein